MKKMKIYLIIVLCILCLVNVAVSQSTDAYTKTEKEEKKGFFDPSKLSVQHSLSFGASSSSQFSGLKSQSLYSTMLTYQFSSPLTLNFNFSLPIHSTYSSAYNLNTDNLQSMEYFKNIPFDATLLWQPSEKFAMQISISKGYGYYYSPFSSSYLPLGLYRNW